MEQNKIPYRSVIQSWVQQFHLPASAADLLLARIHERIEKSAMNRPEGGKRNGRTGKRKPE